MALSTTTQEYIGSIEYTDGSRYYYTTIREGVTFGGVTYLGSTTVEVSGINSSTPSQIERVTVTVNSIPATHRARFLRPVGIAICRVEVITNNAGTWQTTNIAHKGLLENPVLSGSTYTFEIVPRYLNIDYSANEYWNADSHRARFPNDAFFDNVSVLTEAIANRSYKTTWPPFLP